MSPARPSGAPRPPAAGNDGAGSGAGGPAGEPKAESSPTYRELRELLERGDYAAAVQKAYRGAFDGTVRAYGLEVPRWCSDRRFLKGFLRPDMGRLTELLPELHQRYEPVRFGRVTGGDRESLRALLERLYSETVLARIHDPAFQPSTLSDSDERRSEYDALFRRTQKRGKA